MMNSPARFALDLAIALILIVCVSNNSAIAQLTPAGSDYRLEVGRSFEASKANERKTPTKPEIASSTLTDVSEALSIIRENHIGSKSGNPGPLTKGMISGMLKALDPHSRFYDQQEFASLNGEHNGEYYGTGISIAPYSLGGVSGVYVISATERSPAARSGIGFGERIIRINGTDVSQRSVTEIRDLIRGPRGSTVEIETRSAITHERKSYAITRERISQPSIERSIALEDDVGYIGLNNGFSFSTAAEFGLALAELKNTGCSSLIIDLRGNGGGIFEQAIEIAEIFLPKGSHIVSQSSRTTAETRVWISENPAPETLPLILLVDEQTASASEVLTAALQDNDRAVVIGNRTFGKGLVQDVIELENGNGLVLTTARYYAPSGRLIQREYSDAGNYAYFTRTEKAALIDAPANAYRTIGNRVVYGGNGIEPDRVWKGSDAELPDPAVIEQLEDEAFAFVINRLLAGSSSDRQDSVRSDDRRTNDANAGFLRKRIKYYFDLADGGPKKAEESALRREIALMITESDNKLARSFAQGMHLREQKKARQVTSQTGLKGRNRRN